MGTFAKSFLENFGLRAFGGWRRYGRPGMENGMFAYDESTAELFDVDEAEDVLPSERAGSSQPEALSQEHVGQTARQGFEPAQLAPREKIGPLKQPVIFYDGKAFGDVLALQERINSLFQEFNRGQGEVHPASTAAFVPAVDVYEDEHQIVLKLEVPGLKESDFDIQQENNTLIVRGERKFEKEEKEANFINRIERHYGSFYRSFTIPNTVFPEDVKASYDAGVLRIELKKRAEAQPKQPEIAINVTDQPKPARRVV